MIAEYWLFVRQDCLSNRALGNRQANVRQQICSGAEFGRVGHKQFDGLPAKDLQHLQCLNHSHFDPRVHSVRRTGLPVPRHVFRLARISHGARRGDQANRSPTCQNEHSAPGPEKQGCQA